MRGGGSSDSASSRSGWLATLAWPVTYPLRKVGVLPSPANTLEDSSGNDNGTSTAAAGEAAGGKGSGNGGISDGDRYECGHASVGGGGGGGGEGEDDEVCWREGQKRTSADVSSRVESPSAESFSAESSSVESSSTGAGSAGAEGAAGEQQQQRRIFLEFFGPVVEVFAALGLPAWLSELLTVVAAQLCPLLAAMPLLRLSPRSTEGAGGDSAGASKGLRLVNRGRRAQQFVEIVCILVPCTRRHGNTDSQFEIYIYTHRPQSKGMC